MTDNTQEYRNIERGRVADELLNNEVLSTAFRAVTEHALSSMKATQPKDTETREKLFLLIQAADMVQDMLRKYIITGKISADKPGMRERIISRIK